MFWVVVAALAASFASVAGSGAILLLGRRAERAAVWMLAFAVGTLTGAATLDLLPEALGHRPAEEVMMLFLGGMVLFIFFERAIRWRHTHTHEHEHAHPEEAATAQVLLWGDALHNLIDGMVLGVTFGAGSELGVIASIAVFAHEVPQEIGDFAVLLSSGMPRRRALLWNYLSSLTVLPGAVAAYFWSSSVGGTVGWLLPIAAGGFVYIALADLVPSLHHHRGRLAALAQLLLIVGGAAVIWFAGNALHRHVS